MADTSEFDTIVRGIAARLKQLGFSRRGNSFYRSMYGNWEVVNLQKSQKSSREEVLFTVNLGIASATLMAFRGRDPKKPPSEAECDWRQRIGRLLPVKSEKWWAVNQGTDVGVLVNDLTSILEGVAIPELDRFAGDTALRDLWMSQKSPGLTDFSRLAFLGILVKTIGPKELLPDVIQQLIDSVPAGLADPIVSYYVKKLSEK